MTPFYIAHESILLHMLSNPSYVAAFTCDREGCDDTAVKGEIHECTKHQIATWREIIAQLVAQPDIDDMDSSAFCFAMEELERLNKL